MAREDDTQAPAGVTGGTVADSATETVVTEAPATDAVATGDAPAETSPDAATTDAPAEATGPTEEELATLKAAYDDAVKEAVAARDTKLGEVPADKMTAISAAFAALTPGQRKTARVEVNEAMHHELTVTQEISTARAYVDIKELISTVKTPKATVAAAKVDPTQDWVNLQMAHYLAGSLLKAPADVDANWAEQLKAQLPDVKAQQASVLDFLKARDEWDSTETHPEGATEPTMPQVSPVYTIALQIAAGRPTRRVRAAAGSAGSAAPRAARMPSNYSGPRRSIGGHIAEFFADKASGTAVKVAEIVRYASSAYGPGEASSGAITAYFDRGNFAATPGITPVTVDGVKGAQKA